MTPLSPHLFIGLDLGQRQDPAALAILERTQQISSIRNPVTLEFESRILFTLRHAERFPLGLPYITVVHRIGCLVRSLTGSICGAWPVSSGHLCSPHKTLVVDASGVGAPVVEMLRKANFGIAIVPILITGGQDAHAGPYGTFHVPRRDLITRLRIVLEHHALKIPANINERETLTTELLNLSDRSTSKHDDLAIATALALYHASTRLIHRLGTQPKNGD
jgi:hypothetical protein